MAWKWIILWLPCILIHLSTKLHSNNSTIRSQSRFYDVNQMYLFKLPVSWVTAEFASKGFLMQLSILMYYLDGQTMPQLHGAKEFSLYTEYMETVNIDLVAPLWLRTLIFPIFYCGKPLYSQIQPKVWFKPCKTTVKTQNFNFTI